MAFCNADFKTPGVREFGEEDSELIFEVIGVFSAP
jgi:hypothetical protein